MNKFIFGGIFVAVSITAWIAFMKWILFKEELREEKIKQQKEYEKKIHHC